MKTHDAMHFLWSLKDLSSELATTSLNWTHKSLFVQPMASLKYIILTSDLKKYILMTEIG